MRPMLAATIDDTNINRLAFPLLASIKLDGIRVIIHPDMGPVTRQLKPIRSKEISQLLSPFRRMDGEIIVGSPTAQNVFQRTTSAVMSFDGQAVDMHFYVFDSIAMPRRSYAERLAILKEQTWTNPYVSLLPQIEIHNMSELLAFEEQVLVEGYEGIMLRNAKAPYKFGRSTFREASLLKLKRMIDTEATVIRCNQLYMNNNSPSFNNLGLTKRSQAQEHLIPMEQLGSFTVHHPIFGEFDLGTGFTAAERVSFWQERMNLLGKTLTLKYQHQGMKDKPRFPSFKGFRED